ncbi:XRE family transcriptional regulator [Cronobacter sakazakii]|nr:XRE family transcriptional regulator [Cronobacter sakazakii]
MTKLTPNQIKHELKMKGWSHRELALRWSKSETWISKIINNVERGQHWNDAFAGLPINMR